MNSDNDGAELLIIGIKIVIVLFILYIMFLLAMAAAGIAAIGGTLYGGGTALGNYFSSLKENIIDSNKEIYR